MIIFHEGLPRSGKSYEAMVFWIIAALQSGREVFAYIAGLNYEKIAEAADLPIEVVNNLLHQLTAEQIPEIYKHVKKDSLVVIDELQNFFPAGRQKLSPEMTRFIAEHGHDGLDIINMGQSLADCHAVWKRRTERKVSFLKMSMIGKEGKYKWTVYNGHLNSKGEVVFIKANSGIKEYDEKYFGTYKSHTDGTKNKGNLKDSRSNIFNNWKFKLGLPAFVCVLFFAVSSLMDFFNPEKTGLIKHEPLAVQAATPEPKKLVPTIKEEVKREEKPDIKTPPVKEEYVPIDYLDELINNYRPRLSGFMVSEKDNRMFGYIDVLTNSFHLKERLDLSQVKAMGWEIQRKEYGVDLVKNNVVHVVTSWPMDSFGRVSNHTRNTPQISGQL